MGKFNTDHLHTIDLEDGLRERLEAPFSWSSDNGLNVEVPSGFITDFASIPRIAWRILPPWDKHKRAAVVHDWLYGQGIVTKSVADGMFYECMADCGVEQWKRWVMWKAVCWFGFAAWNQHRKEQAMRSTASALLFCLALLFQGCHTVEFQEGDAHFKRSAPPWANLQFSTLQITVSTNGTKSLRLDGYKSDLTTGFEMGLQYGQKLIESIPK